MNRKVYFPFVFVMIALGAGCAAEDAAKIKPEDACLKRAEASCKEREMCTAGFSVQRDFGTKANCIAVEKQLCVESVTRTGSGVTAEAAEKCAVALAKRSCADRAVAVPECATAVGKLKDGTPCISSNQCLNSYCDLAGTAACGVCASKLPAGKECDASSDCVEGLFCYRVLDAATMMRAPKGLCTAPVAAGAVCNNDDKRCGEGFGCAGFDRMTMTDGTCLAPAQKEGAVCNAVDKICVVGLICVGMPTMDGVCKKPLVMEGAICDRRSRMEPTCDATFGMYCLHATAMDPTGVCKKRGLAKVGDDCGTLMDGTQIVCEGGNLCQRMLDTVASTVAMPVYSAVGKCVAQAKDGQACNTDNNIGPACEAGLRCVQKMMGATEGLCVKRDYEKSCMLTKK